ncbi:acyl-coenzyme A synthetase/AMP-(fatty) acid ligase [Saccharothrix ecbatanensis]|uniref:Long-chain-fatty-acid--CoA ligase n=1 Tax=Saccharothrix ecbatanensis TaxID=1105145 RepID=A0A7W9HJ05_9PSEU|nr:fatty acid--CoA ligase family protein [Saccharothrix ecbatanensis]MBB5802808.1 acyl-coenzyme A synthetase/AMP-(fatty) acid ligase [Saccharothrix ecbatanensis]
MAELFPHAIFDLLASAPDTPAFEHGTRVVSRGELLEMIAAAVDRMRSAGLGPGDGLALATGVTPEAFAGYVAGWSLGCRVVGIAPQQSAKQVTHVASGVDVLVVDDTAPAALLSLVPRVLHVKDFVGGKADLVVRARPDDIAWVVHTSGSTGTPKGVQHSYAGLARWWSWHPAGWDDRARALATRYGRLVIFGTLASLVVQEHLGYCLASGGTAVIPEGTPQFPDVLADLRITATLLTVPRLHHVLDVLKERQVDLSALKAVLVAGSALAPHRMAEAVDVLGDVAHSGYGQTETGMLTLLTAQDVRDRPEALASVGKVWSGVELEVRDEAGRALPAGESGEIWSRTSMTFVGYRDDPEESADVRQDGWVRSRDIGHFDEHGYLYLTGRARDVVIVNAILHHAGPIERVLAADPDVDQAYVLAVPDERTGEAVHAFVVAVAGRTPDPDRLRTAVADELGTGATPAEIRFIDAVPVGPGGKPDKRALLR